MRYLFDRLRSQIQYLIILPYLALMILVMLVGSGIAITLVADNWQERFNNQLGQVARNFSESFAQREIGNITFLGQIAFTAPNEANGAPAILDAMREGDGPGLERSLKGLWQLGQSNESVNQDRLIIFDTRGVSLVDWERSPTNPSEPTRYFGTNLSNLPLVKAVLNGEQATIAGSERLGDKYSGLIAFRSSDGQDNLYFFTVAPAYQSNADGTRQELVGGLLVAQRLDPLLQYLQSKSQSAISTIYDVNGTARATTITGVEPTALDLSEALINQVAALNTPVAGDDTATPQRAGDAEDPCLDIGNLTGRLASPVEITRLPSCSVNTTQTLSGRDYQVVYAPLLIRGVQSGYFSVGLSRDFVVSAWSSSRWAVLSLTGVLALVAVFLGYYVARRITRPLGDLVDTAAAVTSGDLARRSQVHDTNELGQLSTAFNQMTEHLLRLYTTSRELNRTIEIDYVLTVVSNSAASFVPGTEALALVEQDEGYAFRLRPDAPEAMRSALLQRRLPAGHPLLIGLAAEDVQESRLTPVDDVELRAQAGLGPDDGVRTLYAAPLFRQRHFAGALLFAHPEADALDDAHQQTLAVIANMALAVLSNAVLYAQVQQDAKERQAILTSISDGVVVCDEKGQIMLLNRAAEEILDLHDWQRSRPHFDALPLEAVPQRREMFGQGPGEQFRIGERFVTLSRAPVVAEDSQALGEVIVLHDVTEEVAVDKAKTDFIATISHELRTPLTVIRGFTELLLRGSGGEKLTADQTELMDQVRARAVDMTNMVNNAILIADIESGKLRAELQPQDVEMVLSMALVPLRQSFDAKHLEITLELPPDLPAILADRELLRRAFGLILDNALRYTERGGLTVRAWATDQGQVQIDFSDTGQGIAPEMLPRLFKRFQRIEGNNSTQRGGGLGLAITRQLIERHGGKVSVVSTPGQGSTFTITLLQANEHSLALAQSNGTSASA
jgi:signal transduction histidine kinase/HAMP domain-containing protein